MLIDPPVVEIASVVTPANKVIVSPTFPPPELILMVEAPEALIMELAPRKESPGVLMTSVLLPAIVSVVLAATVIKLLVLAY